jgi:hypothetical protein
MNPEDRQAASLAASSHESSPTPRTTVMDIVGSPGMAQLILPSADKAADGKLDSTRVAILLIAILLLSMTLFLVAK